MQGGGLWSLMTDLVVLVARDTGPALLNQLKSHLKDVYHADHRIRVVVTDYGVTSYEMPALLALWEFARAHAGHAMLYMHTKGVGKVLQFRNEH